ncbi:hypothetical protein IWQ57_004612 [Coemansia nantahalensis]|uniref:Uncharacterized protein n=1 Tax=Coemansia nantahalensis TaxID=2789366 RepID=A0ACC1JRH0_9FUNG|nr:hypothetical protein IWQ57_004612 [Coemansia nantahalensis]
MLQGPDTSGVLDELKRLREENARMRVDHEALQSRLYTKEGEVKIVRENLARTEIENTHLQERLANQIAASAASQAQVEASLKAEVERLRTELRFQQHEAKTVATPGARTPVQRTAAARCGAGTPGTPGSASAPSGYPSLADFHSTPTAPASRAESTPTKLRGRQAAEQLARGDRPTDETPAQLLAILAGIAERPGAEPGRLMRLAVRLAETARDRRPEAIDEFHAQACAAVDRALGTGRFGLLAAVLRLLVQTAETLPAIRARWLADAPGGPLRAQQVAAAARRALEASVAAAAAMRAGRDESAACGEAIAAQVELLLRVAAHQPAAALGGSAWAEFRPCELAAHFGAGLPLGGLGAVLKLLAALIRASPPAWARLRDDPPRFQQLLLAALRRLRAAFVAGEPQMLETHRNLLVLVAAAVVVHEDDSRALINAMPQFTVALVHWLLDEHAVLVALHARRPVDRRRAAVFCEHTKCLSVVLSEVADVPALLGGDSSPLFFAFVAAATRMTLGQAPLADQPDIHEVAADLLAYVVTEDQAVAIQGLADFA